MMLLLAFLSPSFGEMILIAIIALLLYGSDLPQVARTWGKTYQEFRRHLSGMQRDLNNAMYADEDEPRRLQYYPEFQDDASEAEAREEADAAGPTAVDSTALAEGEAARLAAADASVDETPDAADAPEGSAPTRDAHGAA